MTRILSFLKDQGLNCFRTNYSRVEYDCFDVYLESNESGTGKPFEPDFPTGRIRTLAFPQDAVYKVDDVIAGNPYLPVSLPTRSASLWSRAYDNAKAMRTYKKKATLNFPNPGTKLETLRAI